MAILKPKKTASKAKSKKAAAVPSLEQLREDWRRERNPRERGRKRRLYAAARQSQSKKSK